MQSPVCVAGDALAAYNILRAFSWQIRLSPFAFEELCAALFNPNPSPLMDELHVSFYLLDQSVHMHDTNKTTIRKLTCQFAHYVRETQNLSCRASLAWAL